jgi:hypothetical protein
MPRGFTREGFTMTKTILIAALFTAQLVVLAGGFLRILMGG